MPDASYPARVSPAVLVSVRETDLGVPNRHSDSCFSESPPLTVTVKGGERFTTSESVTASTAATITATAAGTLTLLRLVHLQRPTVEISAIQSLHGTRCIGVRHFDEPEAARTTRVPIRNQRNFLDRTMLREKFVDGLIRGREGEVSNI